MTVNVEALLLGVALMQLSKNTAILTLEKFNKICRHSGSSCSDSEESYPESPYSKPQMGYFRDAVCGTKEGDSGSFAPLRYANVRNDGKMRIASKNNKLPCYSLS